MNTIPSYLLLTNDEVEPVHDDVRICGDALRFTHFGYRGLFGGIWRMGRTFFHPELGPCLGPEVFYPVGATTKESRAAFSLSRSAVYEREAQLAQAAHRFVTPIAQKLTGIACLGLANRTGDRHVVHAFLPTKVVRSQFTPRSWFLFWQQKDAEFHEFIKPARLNEFLAPNLH